MTAIVILKSTLFAQLLLKCKNRAAHAAGVLVLPFLRMQPVQRALVGHRLIAGGDQV